ncbi:MAG: hypothetical protein LBC97_12130 [Bifidobacteriaceae bacterium]|nr:hypothetical protein [Bifidobacteriaceae bacterium]
MTSQAVGRRGVDAIVLVPIEEWRRIESLRPPTLKELLLSDEDRFDMELPSTVGMNWRGHVPAGD